MRYYSPITAFNLSIDQLVLMISTHFFDVHALNILNALLDVIPINTVDDVKIRPTAGAVVKIRNGHFGRTNFIRISPISLCSFQEIGAAQL